MRRLIAAAPVALTALVFSIAAASASLRATVSPQALYSATLKAGEAQRSVHWTSRAASGGAVVAMVCDVARTSGIQRISYSDGTGSGKATVLVVGGNVYLRGDAFTLTGFMGFNAFATAKYADTWIEIPKSDPRYPSVAAGITLRSAVEQVAMVSPFRQLPNAFVHGKKVLVVAGEAPGTTPAGVVLYARPGALHLPVGAVSKTTGAASSIFFSRWNEPVLVSKPARAILIAKTGL
jgi:hypothetical protein